MDNQQQRGDTVSQATYDLPTDPYGVPAHRDPDTAEIPVVVRPPDAMQADDLWHRDRLWTSTLEFALQSPQQSDDRVLQRRTQDRDQPWRSTHTDQAVRRTDLRLVLHYVNGRTDGPGWMALFTLADHRVLLLDVQWSSHLNMIQRLATGQLLWAYTIPDLVQWGMTDDQRQRMYTAPTFERAHEQVQLHLRRWTDKQTFHQTGVATGRRVTMGSPRVIEEGGTTRHRE
jgi:hypothetical protein